MVRLSIAIRHLLGYSGRPRALRTILAVISIPRQIAFLFTGGGWRRSNLFLVPDLLVSGILAGGALASARTMPTVLLTGFAMGVGVFSVAVASYLVEGTLGIGATIALVICLAASAGLLRGFLATTTE